MNDSEPTTPAHDNSIRGYWQLVRIVCFSLIVPFMISVAFAVVPQGIEMLHALVEFPYGAGGFTGFLKIACFVGASVMFAHLARFWASALLDFRYPAFPPELLPGPVGIMRARVWIPKCCAALVHAGIAIGFFRSGWSSPGLLWEWPISGKASLYAGAIVYAILAASQIWYACFRTENPTERTADPAFHRFTLKAEPGETTRQKVTRRYALATLLIALGLIVLFAYGPDGIGREFGAAGIFCIAGCCWVTFGNFLRLLALQYRLPLVSGAVVGALIFSLWVDNHDVHTVAASTAASPMSKRATLAERYRDWHKRVQEKHPLPAGTPRPLFIIAAEGGGVRAAFWTAKVLCTLQHTSLTPCADGQKPVEFAPHAFALSGVSGGSLGSAVFAAMCADQMPGNIEQADNMLSRDHLAPVMAKMFFPDMLQRFLPFEWSAADRARGLERSWDVAWREMVNPPTNHFAEPMQQLWANTAPGAPLVPNLFLNATVVETGQRIIASNVPLKGTQFLDTLDAAESLPASRDFTLGSATHLSARFTYFSPAGRISEEHRVVDGGYFENSGTVTAMEILRIIRDEIELEQASSVEKVIPYLILISNEPGDTDIATAAAAAAAREDRARAEATAIQQAMIAAQFKISVPQLTPTKKADPLLITEDPTKITNTIDTFRAMPNSFASETLAPIRALLRTRESRGSLAKLSAYYAFNSLLPGEPTPATPTTTRTATDQRFIQFRLDSGTVLLPLGWTLSKPSCTEMSDQLWGKKIPTDRDGNPLIKAPGTSNPARMAHIMRLLRNPDAAAVALSKEKTPAQPAAP